MKFYSVRNILWKQKYHPQLLPFHVFFNYLSTYLINPIKFPNTEIIGGLIFLVGLVTAMLAIIVFKKNKTTVNPMNLEETTTLVTTGIFSLTRNPMYLGLFFVICSTILFFGSWSGIIILIFFFGI